MARDYPRYLRRFEVAEMIGIDDQTVGRWERYGWLPRASRFRRADGKAVATLYPKAEVIAAIERRVRK